MGVDQVLQSGFTMGKKDNSKAKEKKAERKAMEARMNRGVVNVKAANAVEDPLALLPKPFSVFNKNGLDLKLETVRAPEVPEEGKAVAFSHFRYDMDYDDEVVYCYEIQVEKGYQRKGLGRFIMKVLEMLCLKADMLKLMATIFKKDQP